MTEQIESLQKNWIIILISIVCSNAVTFGVGYLTFKGDRYKVDSNSITEMSESLFRRVKDLEKANRSLEQENKDLYKRLTETQIQISRLQDKVDEQFNEKLVLLSYFDYMPGPAWIKNKKSKMLYINREYSKQWGVSQLKYKGSFDHDIWPQEVAEKFVKHDKMVLKRGGPIVVVEEVPEHAFLAVGPDNPLVKWLIWKFPVVLDGEVIGVGGIAIRYNQKTKKISE